MEQSFNKLNELYKEIVDIRRFLHEYPELSFEEVETAKYIEKEIDRVIKGTCLVSGADYEYT
ncbi:hypothetical protein B481_0008 [Planococcus halocryophilus Or1]|uniref:hypothetical protein n=1 Tax=Planococcus halocryophilus TaxID=1215089 RepID=UPI0002B87221|nr:hypothetical protein [Planococcus halocryophilus]EMF48184.1 hypothetical protein B481_0008 [Planococcus halocryophilus Or1]